MVGIADHIDEEKNHERHCEFAEYSFHKCIMNRVYVKSRNQA